MRKLIHKNLVEELDSEFREILCYRDDCKGNKVRCKDSDGDEVLREYDKRGMGDCLD